MTAATPIYSVLVVEDNPDLVMGLQDLLRHDGYTVTATGTVASAIELVRTHSFNVIILDLGLPDGDGLEVLKECHRLNPSLPVVIVTAHIAPDRTVGSLAEGAFAYLTKPYDREELRHILRRAIGIMELVVKVERTESLLSESEERFRSLVESATDAIVVADWHGKIVSWNRSASKFFDYVDEEVIGQPLTLLMPARYHQAHKHGLTRLESTGTGRVIGSVFEVHGLRKDGTEFPIELSLATWNTAAGNFYSGIIRDISERKQAEEILRRSEAFITSVVENLPHMVFVKDAQDLRFVRLNKAGEELLGHARSELLGKTDYDFFPKEEAEFFTATDREVLASNCLRDIPEEPIQTKKNGLRILHTKKIPLYGTDGAPQYLLGISEDITKRKQMENVLRASEERLELVIQGSSDGFWDGRVLPDEPWSSPRTPVWWSPRIKAMLGYTDEEFPDVLESWASRLHPADTDRVFAALTAHIDRRDPYDVEYRLLTKAGEYQWFRARGQAIWDDTGQIVRMSGSLQCVTDLRHAEDALRRSEQLLRDVADNTTAVIYVKYADGRYLFVNHRFERIFDLTADQIIGYTDHEIFPREIADAFRANDVVVIEQNRMVEYEEVAPHTDGPHTYISIKLPLCDHTGRPYAICGISTDITERKRIEQTLRAHEEQLRLALTSTEMGTWNWDLQSGHIYWSSQADRFLGLSDGAGPRTQNDWLTLVYREDRESMARTMRQAMDQPGANVVFEHRVMRQNGSFQWCVWTGEIIRDRDGTALHILGTVRATDRSA